MPKKGHTEEQTVAARQVEAAARVEDVSHKAGIAMRRTTCGGGSIRELA